jgi:ribonuclease HII
VSASIPDLSIEESCKGLVAGIDEAGRGPLVGPVVAACVILNRHSIPAGINDSKMLTASKRDMLYIQIMESAHVGIGVGSLRDIENYNILGATKLAMQRALSNLLVMPEVALVDGNQLPKLPCRGIPVIKGDSKSLSIAAASIIAKVTRDRIMHKLARKYKAYGWHTNSGYGTAEHRMAIEIHGITPHHRKGFAPVREYLERLHAVNPPH